MFGDTEMTLRTLNLHNTAEVNMCFETKLPGLHALSLARYAWLCIAVNKQQTSHQCVAPVSATAQFALHLNLS